MKRLHYYFFAWLLTATALLPQTTSAAVSDWQKGVSIQSRWDTDFASDSFRQSLQQAKDAGATHVSLIVQYYQANVHATDLYRGWNTPTDEALRAGIQTAHALGLKVILKPHIDPQDGAWRANISPWNRTAWFASYKAMLMHYARLAQDMYVSGMVVGTELITVATATAHPDNTAAWKSMIQEVRTVFSGTLSYSANWGSGDFAEEVPDIHFWDALDYIGISGYYEHHTGGNSVAELKNSWQRWNTEKIKPVSDAWGKPVVFTELGYRSVSGTRFAPWDPRRGGSYDSTEQENLYEALFSYWNDYGYLRGVSLWDWSSDPNAGGTGDAGYTPQNKPAQSVMTRWFTSATQPNPEPNPNPTPDPVPTNGVIDVWWPTDNATVSGVQPWKALLQNTDINTYTMYWQVDGDRLNDMYTSYEDWPHKEAWVDVSGWNWKGSGPYAVTFIAKNSSGNTMATRSISINIYH